MNGKLSTSDDALFRLPQMAAAEFSLRWVLLAITVILFLFIESDELPALLCVALAQIPEDLDDVSLVKSCAASLGNRALWREFFERFHERFRLWVRHAMEQYPQKQVIRMHDNIDDVVQEVYLRLIQHQCRALQAFHGETAESLYCYLKVIAGHLTINILRARHAKKRPREEVSLETISPFGGEWPGDGMRGTSMTPETNDEAMRLLDLREQINYYLNLALQGPNKTRDKLLFQFSFFEGLTPEEISAMPGIEMTAHAIEVAISRARHRLVKFIGQLGV